MPTKLQCENPDCMASFADASTEHAYCPQCGTKVTQADASNFTSPPTRTFNRNTIPPSFQSADDATWQCRKGTLFAGRFSILNRLGRGGMGEVYHARDTKLPRDVAIKMLLPQWVADENFLKRFEREAHAVASLKHPNICPIYDVGEWEGRPYILMEFVNGRSLENYLKSRSGPLDPAKAARLVRVIAIALQAAHDASIIHRDLKPDNIMLSKEGRPIVMDFGLAKALTDSEADHLTSTGVMMGTAPYMPIEQFRDAGSVDHRSDIYSLGVIFYRILTGKLPYPGRSLEAVLSALIESKAAVPSGIRPETDARLDAIVMKAMARDAADRFDSMKEFVVAIDRFLKGQPATQADPVEQSRAAPRSIDSLRDVLPATVELRDTRPQTSPLRRTPMPAKTQPEEAISLLPHSRQKPEPIVTIEAEPFRAPNPRKPRWQLVLAGFAILVLVVNVVLRSRGNGAAPREVASQPPSTSEAEKSQPVKSADPDLKTSTFAGRNVGDLKRVLVGNLEVVLCWIPAGKFTMGSPPTEMLRFDDEGPVEVTLTQGFWMMKTEVTQELYEALGFANPSGVKGPKHPVDSITYGEAVLCAAKISKKLRESGQVPPDWEVCLPTEAQWEYASRAGTQTALPFGATLSSKQANMDGQHPYGGVQHPGSVEKGIALKKTCNVGNYQPNAWGLLDTVGNVWEWTLDAYSLKLPGGQNPRVAGNAASERVFRGGGYAAYGSWCRSARRLKLGDNQRHTDLGIRLVVVPITETTH